MGSHRIVVKSEFSVWSFPVPQGKESDWQYGSSEGRSQLAASANFKRLVIVAMHRDQLYTDMQAVQAELSQMVMELAPPGMPDNQQVTSYTGITNQHSGDVV